LYGARDMLRLFALALVLLISGAASGAPVSTPLFELSFPDSARAEPVTGRILLMISRSGEPEVRFQVGWINSPPLFGADVKNLRPGESIFINGDTLGYPLRTLRDIPPGDYYVQALLNVYTEFHRADGHTIWAHMDQWEGQHFNTSPGNLLSKVQKLHLDATTDYTFKVELTDVIPPIQVPADSKWVKRVKIQSQILTRFWGHPIYLGAVVLLPHDYGDHPERRYPVIYEQDHFSLQPPFGFNTEDHPEEASVREFRQSIGVETGYQFYRSWQSADFPQMIAVTLLHPTPYYDDSYAVNSANNGPYGDALMTELIPYLEKQLRIIHEPYARVLTGGSTGGWESLALQIYYPDFFGGAWAFYPDPVDFRRYLLVNIYQDSTAFVFNSSQMPYFLRGDWTSVEQPIVRSPDGHIIATIRQDSQLESVLASRGRSGGVLENWEAVYGPVGDDGYPRQLWDKDTGRIDHTVAEYMRSHGYDLQDYLRIHWETIGHELVGKMHVFCGDMDNFYLNESVYLLQQFFHQSQNPHYGGSFEYGRPRKGHGWQPMTNAKLVRNIARYIAANAPEGADLDWVGNSVWREHTSNHGVPVAISPPQSYSARRHD